MVGTREQFIRLLEEPKETCDLNQMDRDILGGDIRLTIPLGSRYQLRNVADLLRGYAAEIDFITRQAEMDERSLLFHLKFKAKLLNKRIREVFDLTGKAKSPKPYRRNNVS